MIGITNGESVDIYWLSKFLKTPAALELVIPDTPPSMNNYLKHTRWATYKTPAARRYQSACERVFREHQATHTRQWLSVPIPIGVCIRLTISPKTIVDVDNTAKVLIDAFKGLIYDDDRQIQAMFIDKVVVVPERKQKVGDILKTTFKVWIETGEAARPYYEQAAAAQV